MVLIYESYILISDLSLSYFFIYCFLFVPIPLTQPLFLLGNFSKFTLQITLPTASLPFAVVIKCFYVPIIYIFCSNHIPLLDHSPFLPVQVLAHATTSKERFFYLVLCNSHLAIIFHLIYHIIRKFFFNSKDFLPLLYLLFYIDCKCNSF